MVDYSTLSRDFSSEAVARFFYYGSSGAVILFLSRQFSPSEYGNLFLAISVLTVFRLFSSLGLAKSAAKYVSHYTDVDERQVRNVIVSSLKYNLVAIAIVASVVIFGAGGIASVLDKPELETLIVVGSIYVVCATLYNYARVTLQGFTEIFTSAAVYASEGLGRIVGVLVLVTLGYGILGALVGYIVGFALATVLGLAFLYKRLPEKSATDPIADGLRKRILRYSLPLTVTRGAWVLDREIDIIIVGYLLNPAVVGFYAISKQIITFSTGPAGSLGFSLGPQFNEASVAEDQQHARETYEQMMVYILLFYIPAVSGLAILADPVVTTAFGQEYRGVVPILQVFCAAIVLIAITQSTEDILDYLGRAKARAVFKIVTSAGNVLLSVLLIRLMGAVGAAIATVCMQAIYAALCLYIIDSEIGFRAGFLLRKGGQVVGITAIMSVVVLSLTQFIQGVFTIGAIILCGTAIWGVLALLGGFFTLPSLDSIALGSE